MTKSDDSIQIPFSELLDSLKKTLRSVFYEKDDIEKFTQKRGFPALVLRDIMAVNPLSVGIPKEFGGRGAKVSECLAVMDAASYESLPLSLTFGINLALFLSPVAKYGQKSAKSEVFNRFLTKQNMGGLMITEPDYGSDAMNMQTYNEKKGSKCHIKGTKHWQGLTGMADYWVMTSRAKDAEGKLGRDIDFHVVDVQQPGQHISVSEVYNSLGLYPIPYGKNSVDVEVPEHFKLQPETTGLKLMMDLLHRSRLHFPGMGMGFIRRMLDEALSHCKTRMVGGRFLISLDQVQHQIGKIQSAFTVCSAMCSRSSEFAGIDNNVATDAVEANSMKAYVTDLMQEAAQILTQLKGANGYKMESFSARGIVDSRPFQIFEGSNDMLYTQISEMVLKMMRRKKEMNLSSFLNIYELTNKASAYFKSLLDFNVEGALPQRKIVDLGKIISRVVSANQVVSLGIKGFRSDLVNDSIDLLKHDVAMLVNSFNFHSSVAPVEEYKDGGSWLAFS